MHPFLTVALTFAIIGAILFLATAGMDAYEARQIKAGRRKRWRL